MQSYYCYPRNESVSYMWYNTTDDKSMTNDAIQAIVRTGKYAVQGENVTSRWQCQKWWVSRHHLSDVRPRLLLLCLAPQANILALLASSGNYYLLMLTMAGSSQVSVKAQQALYCQTPLVRCPLITWQQTQDNHAPNMEGGTTAPSIKCMWRQTSDNPS